LHCVDSRLEENGNWYSRFHIGPFLPNSSLQIGTRLRRSLLNDLVQTSVVAVEVDGAIHEFSRLPGVHESVLDLLFQFQKITFYAPFLEFQEMVIVPFLFFGPGTFYAKDIPWPFGIQCRKPKDFLRTLSLGSILRGRVLLQKNCVLNSAKKVGQPVYLSEFSSPTHLNEKFQRPYPWLSVGFPPNVVERVGFRIECRESSIQENEVLIFEILTSGSISPRRALHEAALVLTCKFSAIANVTFPPKDSTDVSQKFFYKKFSSFSRKSTVQNQKGFGKTLYSIFDIGFSTFQESFGLDLGNLTLNKERYSEFRTLGFQTLGQLLERLCSDFYSFPYLLEKQRRQAFFRLGISSPPNFLFMTNLPLLARTVGRRKTAVANLKLIPGSGHINVNGYSIEEFFSGHLIRLQKMRRSFCILTRLTFDVNAKVKGGGIQGKSEAFQIALARALVRIRPDTKHLFRKYSLLTCDSRSKERRKYGLKKSRKAQQFSKRLYNYKSKCNLKP
jgi:small subunit ribosomal protein S9